MKLGPSLLLALAISSPSFSYAQATCPATLKWTDATDVERTTAKKGRVWKAKVENYTNASVAHLDVDGKQAAIITILPSNSSDTIRLTSGPDKPNPAVFSEISMLLAPPMTRGDWPRMKNPCALADGAGIDFDETDIPGLEHAKGEDGPTVTGTIKREGLNITYSMEADGKESWQGRLGYAPAAKEIDPNTDVQGWHVFRGRDYVETLPAGQPVALGTVIKK